MIMLLIFFFKQKTAYEMRISDWSSDVCSSDLPPSTRPDGRPLAVPTPGSSGPVQRTGTFPSRAMGASSTIAPLLSCGRYWTKFACGNGAKAKDRKSVVEGTRVLVRVDFGGRRILQQTTTNTKNTLTIT